MENKTTASYWDNLINARINSPEYREWIELGKKIFTRYRNRHNFKNGSTLKQLESGYNLIYRNIKTRIPYLLPYIPTITVDRQNKDQDAVARTASIILERVVNKLVAESDLQSKIDYVKVDTEIYGFGTLWIRYNPIIATTSKITNQDNENEEVEESGEYLTAEKIEFDYVSPMDLIFPDAREWADLNWVARRVNLSEDEFINAFPDVNFTSLNTDDKQNKKIEVFEIWDKVSRKIYFYTKNNFLPNDRVLDVKDYPCNVNFPTPKPLMFDIFTDSLLPISRHAQCWSQYLEIDELTKTISGIIPTIKVKGAYDKSLPDFAKIFNASNENALIGIDNVDKYVEKGGISNAVMWYDTTTPTNVLHSLLNIRQQLVEDVAATIGINQILEGKTETTEAYGTNRLKGAFGTVRIQEDQGRVVSFISDLLMLACKFITGCFEPENILKLSTIEFSDENPNLFIPAIELLKDDNLNSIRLEIGVEETRSYVDEAYKAQILDMWGNVFNSLATGASICENYPSMAPVLKIAIMAGVRAQRVGRTVEASLEAALDKLVEMAKIESETPPENPQPPIDPIKQMEVTLKAKQQEGERERNKALIEIEKEKNEMEKTKHLMNNAIEEAKLALKRREQDIEENLKLSALQNGVALAGGGTNIGT